MLFPIFESYDKSGNKQITLENFNDMFSRLIKDEVMLGKVPHITPEQATELFKIFAEKPEEKSDPKLSRM
jgi:Ca2+-binding EF-hand superfamily protein